MPVNNTANNTNSSSYSYLQYKNKITGLASGMDIDSIMEKLMKAESAQMEKLQQTKQKFEWKRDAYREVNTTLSSFEKGIFDNHGLAKNWLEKDVTSSSSAISATANASASGNLMISEAKVATAGNIVVEGKLAADQTIDQDGSFKIKAVNEKGEYTEKEITYKASDKVSDLMSRINASGVGITALSSGNKISLQANATGKGSEGSIVVTEDAGKIFEKLGLTSSADVPTKDQPLKLAEGTNGSITVNGIEMQSSSNKYNVAGYTLNVNKSIEKTDAATTISSTTDSNKIVDNVKKFVETYNGLIEDLNKRVGEKKNLSYQPLTDAQKAEMSEEEIKKWEEKAKSGLLKGDATIKAALSEMRSTLSQYGNGSDDMLAKIGISTTKTWADNGKLEVDENKLKSALEQDPNVVTRIFVGDKESGTKGLVTALRTTAQDAVKTIEKTAGRASMDNNAFSLGKNIVDVDKKIADWKDRLKSIEERYWKQFSAMENAIQKANSQSAMFMQ